MSKQYFVPDKYGGFPKAPYGFRDDAESVAKTPCPSGYVATGALLMNEDLREACSRAESLSDECQRLRTELHMMHNGPWRSALSITWRKLRGRP